MFLKSITFLFLFFELFFAQTNLFNVQLDSIPKDLPLPIIKIADNHSEGYFFASVPYWGVGNNYLVIYNNLGKPVFYKKTKTTCTDFKMHNNGLITYFDYDTKKFYSLDSLFTVVDSFWVNNGYTTDEHDIKFLSNGNTLLIGTKIIFVDMSQYVLGGSKNASVIVGAIQEIDKNKNTVFEWKSEEYYNYTDVNSTVNLLDESFVHAHINSIDVDSNDNIFISARNLNEITKIDRKSGNVIWRLGGKQNQFKFLNADDIFSAQHSAVILSNGNLLLFDNGLEALPTRSRAIEYKIDEKNKTVISNWSFRKIPDITSKYWGNAQRLSNGNTLISWGMNKTAVTEVDNSNQIVLEFEFPENIFSYRIFKYLELNIPTKILGKEPVPQKFYLEQNFPNPFNSSTIIKYLIPKEEYVTLKVYNSLGGEIETLVNKMQNAGNYQIDFHARSNLSSGVYYYVLSYGKICITKKMILLK